jgi:SPP1 gp7 family putative phage head morphogenesis protein
MARLLDELQELEEVYSRVGQDVTDSIEDMFRAHAKNDEQKRRRAMDKYTRSVRWLQAYADLLGRRRILLLAKKTERKKPKAEESYSPFGKRLEVEQFAAGEIEFEPAIPGVPRVPFEQALDDLIDRFPVGINADLKNKGEEVARVYSRGQAFALAEASDAYVARRVQNIIGDVLEKGLSMERAVELVFEEAPHASHAYARTVTRTNISTAYSAGTFQQAADPVIRPLFPAFEYQARRDANTRDGNAALGEENHLALDGLIAATDWPGWGKWAPPNGYNCRCAITPIPLDVLESRGLMKGGKVKDPTVSPRAFANPRFQMGRPDHSLYFGISG